MSRGFVKEGDQEEVPMVFPRAFLPKGTPNYVTPEGLRQLHDEMESLKKEWIDAGSNYITKNYIDAKIRLLSERINTAVLIDPAKANPDIVSFGMYVRYNDKVIRIVGVDEADASKGLISFISPVAKSLIGKKKGDKFEIKVPRGMETVEVQEISLQTNETTSRQVGRQPNNETSGQRVEVHQVNKSTGQQEQSFEYKKVSDSQVSNFSDSKEANCQQSTVNSHSSSLSSEFNPKIDITEFLPLVNEQGNIVGRALYCEIHNGNKVLHPAVHLLVYNSQKEIVGRYWWHVTFGETAEKTLKRRIKELEFPSFKQKFKKQYIRETKTEKELVSVFTVTYDGEILPTPEGKYWNDIFEKD